MTGRFKPAKGKPKVQCLCPSAGGVLRSEEGGVYVPVTPVRHFTKPRCARHILQPIDKAGKRRFLQKLRRDIFAKPQLRLSPPIAIGYPRLLLWSLTIS